MEALRIVRPWSDTDLGSGARKLVEENGIVEGLLRITITAGERATTKGSATITTRNLPDVPPDPALHVATSARRISGPLSQCKSIGRTAESVALREAEAEGAFDAILLNEKGKVVETTARNLFLVTEGSLVTPPTYDGALPGVTRATVLEIASHERIKLREASLSVERVRGADEVFLTGSGVGVLGIAAVDGHRYTVPGPFTERLRAEYERALEAEASW